MDEIFALLLLALVLFGLGPIGAAFVFFRTRRRLNEADRRLTELELELDRMRSSAELAATAPPGAGLAEGAPVGAPTEPPAGTRVGPWVGATGGADRVADRVADRPSGAGARTGARAGTGERGAGKW